MNQIKCQFPNHQQKRITTVCLDNECKNTRFCCYLCIGQFHSGHATKIVEFEQLIDFIQEESKKQVQFPQSYSYGQGQIIKDLEKLSDLIECLQQIIKKNLTRMYGQNLQEYLKQSDSTQQQGIEYWKQLMDRILKYIEADNGLLIPKQQNENQINYLEERSIQIISKTHQSIQEIIKSFVPLSSKEHLEFSENQIELIVHQNDVYGVAVSQDGSLIVSGSDDRTVKIWEIHSEQQPQTIKNDSQVYRVALSPNNQLLAFRDFNQSLKLYNLQQYTILTNFKEHKNPINSIIFSQDSKYLLFGGNDKKLIIWDVIQGVRLHCFDTDQAIEAIVVSHDNQLVSCLCGQGGTLQIWDVYKKILLIQEKNTHKHGLSLSCSSDLSISISCGSEGLIKIWSLFKLEYNKKQLILSKTIQAADSPIQNVILTSDEQYIISICNEEGRIMIHDIELGQLIQVLNSGIKAKTQAQISISNKMSTLVGINCKDKSIKIWTRQQ